MRACRGLARDPRAHAHRRQLEWVSLHSSASQHGHITWGYTLVPLRFPMPPQLPPPLCTCQLHNLDVAEKCLETYLLEVRRYGQDLSAVEVNDQFLCRAYYALGQLVSENSKQLKVHRGRGVVWVGGRGAAREWVVER